MKKLPLSSGKEALVDDEDFEFLSQWKWSAMLTRDRWYAFRNETLPSGKRRVLLLHRVLCPGREIDHEDGNSLNDQKENLRSVSHSVNIFNSKRRAGKSGVVGVSRHSDGTRWVAQIVCEGKWHYLGSHAKLEDAKEARKKAEIKFFGNLL